MKISSITAKNFKGFKDFSVSGIPESVKLVVVVGPNGSGKSTIFDAMRVWSNTHAHTYDLDYHERVENGRPAMTGNYNTLRAKTSVKIHNWVDGTQLQKKHFYFRTAYRHEPDFQVNQIQRVGSVVDDNTRPATMMNLESRVAENYQRIVAETIEQVFKPGDDAATKFQIRERLIGKIREATKKLFGNLILEGVGHPMDGGTFLFSKGDTKNWKYKNLSAGEKAAFDLILDITVKSEAFDDTIFCIDEPELHIHAGWQSKIIPVLSSTISPSCQLWVATHSAGIIHSAIEMDRQTPGSVVFVDFHEKSPGDVPTQLIACPPSRRMCVGMYEVAFGELAGLVLPKVVYLCEGKSLDQTPKRNPSFDVSCYKAIFGNHKPEVDFAPLGGHWQVEAGMSSMKAAVRAIAPAVDFKCIFDRDDRSPQEISDAKDKGVVVLSRRDLESFLWDDEVLKKINISKGGTVTTESEILAEKARLIAELPTLKKPVDDIKAISGMLYNFIKGKLLLFGAGNNAEAFARDTLAPLLVPGMTIYEELHRDIFGT